MMTFASFLLIIYSTMFSRFSSSNLTEDSIFLSSEPWTEPAGADRGAERGAEPGAKAGAEKGVERAVDLLRTGPSLGLLARAYLTLINATKPDINKVHFG
jgi:hypothetical protein